MFTQGERERERERELPYLLSTKLRGLILDEGDQSENNIKKKNFLHKQKLAKIVAKITIWNIVLNFMTMFHHSSVLVLTLDEFQTRKTTLNITEKIIKENENEEI